MLYSRILIRIRWKLSGPDLHIARSGICSIKRRTAIDQYSSLLYLRIGLVSDPMWSIDLSDPTTGYLAS